MAYPVYIIFSVCEPVKAILLFHVSAVPSSVLDLF